MFSYAILKGTEIPFNLHIKFFEEKYFHAQEKKFALSTPS